MRTNVQIYQQRLAELDEELASGKIQLEAHAQLVAELKSSLLDAAQLHSRKTGLGQSELWVVAGIAVAVPVASVLIYLQLSPQDELQAWNALQAEMEPKIDTIIEDPSKIREVGEGVDTRDFMRVMQHHLHAESGSAKGWGLYADLMADFKVLPQATTAARKAYKYDPDNRIHALRFAQFELEENDGRMTPRAEKVLRKFRVKSPEDPGVLMLMGMGFFASERWSDAIDAWGGMLKLLERVPSPTEQQRAVVQNVKQRVAEAQSRLNQVAASAHAGAGMGALPAGHPPAATDQEDTQKSAPAYSKDYHKGEAAANDAPNTAQTVPAVTVEITGDPQLLANAPASAKLYVSARAAGGSPMPLAVQKLKPTQWPVRVTLTKADALTPASHIEQHKAVEISVRWSESGQIAMGKKDPIMVVSKAVNPFDQPTVNLLLPGASGKTAEPVGETMGEIADPIDVATAPVADAVRQITVQVSGEQSLLETAPAGARLYVFAKAASGSGMPLAVKKLKPESWPVTLTLTKDDAMMPTSSIAQFDEVIVSAMWSDSGHIPQGNSGLERVQSEIVNPLDQPSVALSLP
jgi:cytochrome c-type biogenesis protein CcmH